MKELGYKAFSQRLHQTALRDRIPLVGSMATTYRCNLDCRHCYLEGCRQTDEIGCEAWLGIIDQVAAAGCLWLIMTGGEPLLYPEFERIYRHARSRGLLIGVFTNGTLVGPSIIDLWRELPPYVVEVSLYGYSAETYAEVTGRADARDAVFEAVESLAGHAIPTRLNSMVLRSGDAVVVVPTDPDRLAPGDIVMVAGSHPRIHRVARIDRKARLLHTRGDALTRDDPPAQFADLIGRVVRRRRSLAGWTRALLARGRRLITG